MRAGLSITLGEADRRRLETLIADRNSPQKHVWRARIVLMSADGFVGTAAIIAATDTAKGQRFTRLQRIFPRASKLIGA